MDVLMLNAVRASGFASTEATFSASLAGGSFVPASGALGKGFVELPASPRPLPVTVRVIPANPQHWAPPDAHYEYRGPGELVPLDAPLEFYQPPQAVTFLGSAACVVTTVLSRVKDVTAQALAGLMPVPVTPPKTPQRQKAITASWPTWAPEPVAGFHFVANPPVANGALQFDQVPSLAPSTDEFVFQVAGIVAPQLISVSWPKALAPKAGSAPTPFFIFYHHNIGQNVQEGFYENTPPGPGPLGTYPFGWDYLVFGMFRYLFYRPDADPLTVLANPKGGAHQIAHSGKNVVLVVPGPKYPEELGVFTNAAAIDELLREMEASVFRKAGFATAPGIGRTAIGAFSASHGQVVQLLSKPANQAHAFYQDTLMELYQFDSPSTFSFGWASEAMKWFGAGKNAADKRVRAYGTHSDGSFDAILGRARPPGDLYLDEDVPGGRRTVLCAATKHWQAAAKARNAPNGIQGFGDAHNAVSSMMLVDALRRSGF